ncbi:MAG: Maf family protein [Anaerolineales bacterium]|jgi:MAF protein
MSETHQVKPYLILASGSPRRQELISLAGWEVEVRPVDVDESERPGEEAVDLALRLAKEKILAAIEQFGEAKLILAADTVVENEGEILGKPTAPEDAYGMLMKLRGKPHRVHTAIAITASGSDDIVLDVCTTEVPMRGYSEDEVSVYVDSGSPLDKAGAYGIQDQSFHPVKVAEMSGCYANIVGLPICHVVRTMRALGYEAVFDVPSRCQAHTGYDCDVYPQILRDET